MLSIQDLEYIVRLLKNTQYSFTEAIAKTEKDKPAIINYYKSMRKEIEKLKERVVDYLIERKKNEFSDKD